MSATLRISRVAQMPTTPNRNTLYLVDTANPTVFDIFLTSTSGSTFERSFSSTDASLLIESLKNTPNGIVGLDANGLVPSQNLPSFVDDIIEAVSLAALPAIGSTGKIYVTTDNNLTYRWSGSQYIEISSLSGTADAALRLKTARTINGVPFDGSGGIVINAVDVTPRIAVSEKGAPNGVAILDAEGLLEASQLPEQVQDVFIFDSLEMFPEEGVFSKIYIAADLFKLYTWAGLSYNELSINSVTSVAGRSGDIVLNRTDVGLNNVNNVADVNKPVSVAQQAAIDTAEASARAASTPISHIGTGGGAHAVATTAVDGFLSSSDKIKLDTISGINTGDETAAGIRTKLGVTTLTGSNTGDETAASIKSKLAITTLSGSNTGDQTNVPGNAGTATKLLAARSINGVLFDGSQDITINAVDSTSRIASSEKGVANGVATLDATGVIPSSQLPSFVDDVIEYSDVASFPATGVSGKIYIALDTNKTYRWSGSVYVFITSGAVDSVAGKTGIITLNKSDVGLNAVDNTADSVKPVSIYQQTAIDSAQSAAIAASAPIAHVGSSGNSHALATGTVSGFMSFTDKVKLDAITGSNTGDETGATIRTKLGVTTLSGSNTGDQTNIPGNAATATVLQTARTINGVAFDGSQNITINAVDSNSRIASSEKGVANGVATLGADGKVPTAQLPSFVDDVVEYPNLASFPISTGTQTGKLYVAQDTNKVYRWSGSAFINITSGAVDSVAGKTGIVSLVKADVGLGNVDNTSDVSKPVSSAQAAAITTAETNAKNASAPVSHVGSGGSSHALVTISEAGFMSPADKSKLDTVSGTNTGDETGASIRTKLGVTTLTGSNTGDQTNIPGNAATATVLQTSRTINGVAFNGSSNITITAEDTAGRAMMAAAMGSPNGIATLDSSGKVPSAQLPSFVDDIIEGASVAAFPATGEIGKIYVALDTNKTYRWSGSVYVMIVSGAVDSVAGKTGVITLVKADVGLANVDNTSDLNKPVSTATQNAITTAENAAKTASTPMAHVGSSGAAHAAVTASVNGFMIASDKVKLDAILGTNTGDETGSSIRTKLGVTTLTGSNTGDQTNIPGNAATATALQNARTINGVAFDGTANITINAVDSTPRVAVSSLGANNGVATLDATGKVHSTQLPSFVDDVLEFANLAAFPATGETGKIYVALDTNKTYRWSGSVYIYITSGAVDSVAGKTGVITLVKADVGLGNVDNTSDANKPVSAAQQTALDTKIPWTSSGASGGVASLDASSKLIYSQLPIRTLIGLVPAINSTGIIPWDNNGAPLVTDGTQILSQSLGPSDANGKLHISGCINVDCGTANRNFILACFKDSVCIGAIGLNFVTAGRPQVFPFDFYDPDFGSLIGGSGTYSLRLGVNSAATWYVNRMATQVLSGMMNLNRPVRFEELN